MLKNNTNFGLTNNQLKIIAMISMLIDHIGVELLPGNDVLRIIGRLAFPIFAYMIAEGCRYTRNRVKYLSCIFGMGAVFQVVYYFFINSLYQGILITFSLSIITIYCIDGFIKNKSPLFRAAMTVIMVGVLFVVFAAPHLFKKQGFEIDYGALGVMLPVVVYYARGKFGKVLSAAAVLAAMGLFMGGVQWYALAAIPLLLLYNQKRGKLNLKYLFYIFYPTHLVVIYLIGQVL